MFLLNLPVYADSSPIGTCYAAAEAAFPGAQIAVYVDGVLTQATTNDLDLVFQAVAAADNTSMVAVQRNLAGKNALRHAMDCIFDQEMVTWSAVRLNQEDEQLRVRAHGMEFTQGGTTLFLEHVSLQTPGASHTTLQYAKAGVGVCRSVSFEVFPYGATDYYADADGTDDKPPKTDTCAGVNCEYCVFIEGQGCDCRKPAGQSPVCNHTSTTTTPGLGGPATTADVNL